MHLSCVMELFSFYRYFRIDYIYVQSHSHYFITHCFIEMFMIIVQNAVSEPILKKWDIFCKAQNTYSLSKFQLMYFL